MVQQAVRKTNIEMSKRRNGETTDEHGHVDCSVQRFKWVDVDRSVPALARKEGRKFLCMGKE